MCPLGLRDAPLPLACASPDPDGIRYRLEGFRAGSTASMAKLLLWLSWRDAAPEEGWWRLACRRVVGVRAQEQHRGAGYRVVLAAEREDELPLLIGEPPAQGLLLQDRAQAYGLEPGAAPPAHLPCAEIRLDPQTLELRIRRDLMGQRKLVWARISGGLLVASAEHLLLGHPEISREPDPGYLASFLAALPPDHGESAFRAIRTLGAGEEIHFAGGKERSLRTRLEPDPGWSRLCDASAIEGFTELLSQSVADASFAARRPGLQLSAGLDSAAIAAFMAALPRSDLPPLALTYGYTDASGLDERGPARELAHALGLAHGELAVDSLLPFATADLRPLCPDSPLQSPYREWKECSYRQFAAAGVDRVLNGDFGDHLFSESVEWLCDALRMGRWQAAGRGLRALLADQGWPAVLRDSALRRPLSRALGRVRDLPQRLDCLRPVWRERLSARMQAELQRYRDFPRPRQCLRLLGADASQNSSAEHWHARRHGLEIALPLRDLRLVRACLSMPADLFQRGAQHKWLLREALRGRLPEAVRLRPKSFDLSERFLASMRTIDPAIGRLCEEVRELAADYLLPLAADANPAQSALLSWQLAALGSWLRALDAFA